MNATPLTSRLFAACVVLSSLGIASRADATQSQQLMATVTTVAPIYIGPKVQPIPLRTAAIGTRLEVLAEDGEWVQVRFGDPVLGPRVGWVQASLIRIERPELQPMDLSVTPARPQPPASSGGQASTTARSTREIVDQEEFGGFERSGFLIGLSAGPGFLTCEDCDWQTGFAFDFHVGGMIGSTVGLMYDSVATAIADDDDTIVTLATSTVAVQVFTGRGWVKGGVGFGLITCDGCFSFDASEVGFAVMGGAGAELVQRGRFTLDLQGRFTINQFEGIRFYSTMATVGVNWY